MSKSQKPSSHKGSYQNYVEHLNFLYGDARAKYTTYSSSSSSNAARFTLLGKQAAARFHMTEAFHDRYDVADELFGATIAPFAFGLVGTAATLISIWEAGHMLAIKAGLARDDHKPHGDRAVMFFVASLAVSAFAFIVFLKSAVSLVSRTGFTLLDGWKPSTTDRFSTTSLEGGLAEDVASVVELFEVTGSQVGF